MHIHTKLRIAFRGHVMNPLWQSRAERRFIRGTVTGEEIGRYLDRYVDFIGGMTPVMGTPSASGNDEKIFSIWFQGESQAPEVVKACWNSVKQNCPQSLVILDAGNILEWVGLPDYVVRKWKSGAMRPAHFADICRLALLEKYGGLWLDATDYVPAPLPEWLWKEDFFLYMSGEKQRGWYSYIQNCFIRARKGDCLIGFWLKLILEYWRREDKPVDYFVHQLLFRKLVENNGYAASEFAKMPKITQDMTHELWLCHGNDDFDADRWNEITSGAMFQKTEYKSELAKNPRPGSNAAYLLRSSL